MNIVIDTSALLTVILGEPERDAVVAATRSHALIGPGSIPWEIGNAFSAMFKRNRIDLESAREGLEIFQSIPIRYIPTDFLNTLELVEETDMYAYDGYILDCAVRMNAPVLTLDKKLGRTCQGKGIEWMEV